MKRDLRRDALTIFQAGWRAVDPADTAGALADANTLRRARATGLTEV